MEDFEDMVVSGWSIGIDDFCISLSLSGREPFVSCQFENDLTGPEINDHVRF
jgi:hypothetical protein